MKKKTKKIAIAAGAAAAAAGVAAGAYYLYGSANAKEHRAALKKWAGAAKREIEREAKSLKDATLNEKNYKAIVKAVSERYRVLKNLEPEEVAAFVRAVSGDWEKYAARAKKRAAQGRTIAKRAAKKAKKKAR
jgi:hypothetical protein